MIETFKKLPLDEKRKNEFIHQTYQKYFSWKAIAACAYGDRIQFWDNYRQLDKMYLTPELVKLSRVVNSKYKFSLYIIKSKVEKYIRGHRFKYLLKKIKFKKTAQKFNDYPCK
jgi:hypothetical protein